MSDYLTSGRLEDHPFADLAGKLFRESRTGELVLESVQRRRSVWFLGGNPVAVVSDDPQDHIAQVLLEHGKISAEEAQRLAGLPETREALGKPEFLSKETLNWGVKSRFVNLCYDLFRWDEGDYAFTEGEPPRDLIFLKVPAHSLVFKGVGFLSRSAIFDAVPDDAICVAGSVAAEQALYLAPEVREFLNECLSGRTVAEVLSGRDDPDQDRRLMYALVCLGPVALSHGLPADEGEPWPIEEQGISLDNEADTGDSADAFPTAAYQDVPLMPPASDAQPPEKFDFKLPALESEQFDNNASTQETGLPDSGYPFDTEAAPGAFPSFDTDPTPDLQDEPPTPPDTKSTRTKAGAKRTGRGLHVPRLAGIALGSIAAAAVLGVAGWWWLGGEQAPPPTPPITKPAPAAKPAVPAPPPAAATTAADPDPVSQGAVPAPVSAPAPDPTPTAAAAPDPTPTQAAAPAPPVPEATPPPPQPAASARATGEGRYRNALEIFRAGDLDGAASVWETLLAEEHRGRFTVLLMTACQGDTIRTAQQTLVSQQLYLISKKVNGRACFRVCADTFDSREAARRALAALPVEYRSAGAAVRTVTEVLSNR